MPDPTRTGLFSFAEFAGGNRHQKSSAARRIARAGGFNPWSALNSSIAQYIRDGIDPDTLRAKLRLSRTQNVDLVSAFDGFVRWVGKRPFEWMPTAGPSAWKADHLSVNVSPDISLRLWGDSYLIKPYFRADPLDARQVDAALHMTATAHRAELAQGYRVGVLDARRELATFARPATADFEAFLQGEAASCHIMVEALRANARRTA